MKVTLLGHATVLVELNGANLLMDPVLQDPFEEGAVVSCPKRVVHKEQLPRIDTIIISHAHPDHFDIPSLAQLPRACHVLCPEEKSIVYALSQLGFRNVHPTPAMQQIQFAGYELYTTKSSVTNVIEFGIVFRDDSGVFWNQVDTVLSASTIAGTLHQVKSVDLLFAMHASQNFDFFHSRGTAFPADMHQRNLSTALQIHAQLTVPGSAGFRFAGDIDWCNSFLFPMSREQFVADLAALSPTLPTAIANPGDVFEIAGGKVHHHRGASAVASMIEEDTWRLRFDPTAPMPTLSDSNPSGYSAETIRTAVECIIGELVAHVRAAYQRGDDVVDLYRAQRASYALELIFPAGSMRLRLQFDEAECDAQLAEAASRPADIEYRITASALTAWARREKSYFYLRAFARQFSKLYSLRREGDQVVVENKELPDLLGDFLQRKAKGADMALKTRLNNLLRPYLPGTAPA